MTGNLYPNDWKFFKLEFSQNFCVFNESKFKPEQFWKIEKNIKFFSKIGETTRAQFRIKFNIQVTAGVYELTLKALTFGCF